VEPPPLGEEATRVEEVLTRAGASFFGDLVSESGLLATRVERALGELVALGRVTADSFTGLRALLTPSARRPPLGGASRKRRAVGPYGVASAGRWTLLNPSKPSGDESPAGRPLRAWERPEVERFGRALLRRYGVVNRRLVVRETLAPPWRDLAMFFRGMEARGEVRGGRFVAGLAGEQFALPEAVALLRGVRREGPDSDMVVISAADPLNLTGILTPGERFAAVTSTRIGFRAGVPVLVREAGQVRSLVNGEGPSAGPEAEKALARRRMTPALRSYVGSR
jgi:ATP-dependent Lhr-like helicase